MKTSSVVRDTQRLDSLYKSIANVSDIELQAHWARYLCIRSCGLLERGVPTLLIEYSKKHADKAVQNFVEARFARFSSPNAESLLVTIGSFSPTWRSALEKSLKDEMKNAIDSVVANRHLIAHGRDSGVSYTRVSEWHKQVIKFLDEFEKILQL